MKRTGWAILGCSDIAWKRVAPGIRDGERGRLVAFHSRSAARAEGFARDLGAEYGSDSLARVLDDPRVEAVYVATEVERHRELTVAALAAGKHVLVEKPMALDADECRAMIAASERAGRYLSAAYYARHLPKAQVMERVIREGRLGQVVRVVIRNLGYYNPEPADPKYWRVAGRAGGNMLADVGSHRLDLAVYFLGPPARVAGMMDRLIMDHPACDTETALVRFRSGAHGVAMAGSNIPNAGSPGTTMEIYGTEGALLTDPWSPEPLVVLGREDPPVPAVLPGNVQLPLLEDFGAAVAEGRPPRFNGTDGMWATAILAAAYESARTGRTVELV